MPSYISELVRMRKNVLSCAMVFLVGLVVIVSADVTDSTLGASQSAGHVDKLRFRPDGTFKIVVFTDMHYGEGNDLDSRNDALQQSVLDAETPDLIVYLGDIVSGWRGGSESGWMEDKMRRILSYANEQGYKHALLLGNHDDEADLSRTEILEADLRISGGLSLTEVGPVHITGSSNYYINILSPVYSNQEDRVDARLWFFDSMNRGCENSTNSWGCVGRDTVSWMNTITSEDTFPRALQSLAFVHIPLPEHRFAYGDFRATGIRQEDSACPVVNTGLAEQLVNSNISMVVSGHDHQNDFVGNIYYQGQSSGVNERPSRFLPGSGYSRYGDVPMLMAYGRKSGYGSYGPGNITRGARVIQLKTIQTPFDTTSFGNKENRAPYPVYSYSQYWALPPQQMHPAPFSQMQTWVANEFGVREIEQRPGFKYEVQFECYSNANALVAGRIVWMLVVNVIVHQLLASG